MGMVVGKIDVECAKFDLIHHEKEQGEYQVRRYHPAVAAQVDCANDSEGFRQLARYIGVFGTPENVGATETAMTAPVVNTAIAMTAPVVNTPQPIAMTAPVANSTAGQMQFILPSTITMENAPVPTDNAVQIVQLPERTYAVLQYSGSTDMADARTRVSELVRQVNSGAQTSELRLNEDDWQLYRYNGPMTLPFLRTNEIAVRVADREPQRSSNL